MLCYIVKPIEERSIMAYGRATVFSSTLSRSSLLLSTDQYVAMIHLRALTIMHT